ncbi:hypothetical protein [Streptomyces pseudovenezuelae]|uniref:hypothetical protein n=1 Tax=Streptomyces pseudovenezuelae TaxID=67350 RepID=UPI002E34DD84|nr:hypothetical protein [Streptomyces pseudovenezuelae]
MTQDAVENSLLTGPPKTPFDPAKPWPWVSYQDPAWAEEPWEVMSDEDLADAAVRFAIRYLVHSGGNLKIAKAAALVEEAAKRVAADVVAEARTQRYSWGRIAQHFGVGRTAVQKRFGAWPTAERAQALEDQYLRMGHYLKSAELNPGTYENEDEVRETRSRCIRRRRGYALDPIDQLHKVLPRRRRETQSPSE